MAKKAATTSTTPARSVKTSKPAGTPRPRTRKAAVAAPVYEPDVVDQIRVRAYYRSLARPGHEADPMADWLEAESEVKQRQ